MSPINQLLTALRFYATDGHLSTIADFIGIHESTASRIVALVTAVIARLRPLNIKMPEGEQIVTTQNHFFQIAGFPRVIGAIDCTHIRIQSPGK